jgi:uncharacterized membrane protein
MMKWLSGLAFVIALAGVLLFPILRAVAVSPLPDRLRFYSWMVAAVIVASGAAFPICSPRRLQSWVCAILLWVNAALFLFAALRRIAAWYP